MSSLISSWPEWTRLYWLISLPFAILLLWALLRLQQHHKNWHSLLPQPFQALLLKRSTPQQRTFSILLLALAWLCALLALLGPSWQSSQPEVNSEYTRHPPLVIIIQLTPDVLASDLAPNRLQHIRAKVEQLLQQRKDAFTALVVYAGSAHTLVPLSNDLFTSQNLLQALHPDLMPSAGQRADLAMQRALELLTQGAQGRGEILLISAGLSVFEQTMIQQQLQQQPTPLFLLGVGTSAGAPIRTSGTGALLRDAQGAIVISRLNATSLQLLSKQTSSPYATLSTDQSDLDLLGLLSPAQQPNLTTQARSNGYQQDQGHWFILPLLLLALCVARRGGIWLIAFTLLPLLPAPAYAFNFEDLWLRPDQQGQQLLKQQQPALAAERFNDPAWQASAWYLAGEYQRAADAFAQIDTAEAHYNRGNALALAGDLTAALAAYQQALALAPEMLAARYNSEIVSEQLQRQSQSNTADPVSPSVDDHSFALPSDTQSQAEPSTTGELDSTRLNSHTPSSTEPTSTLPDTSQPPLSPPATAVTAAEAQPHYEDSLDLEGWLEQIPDDPSELLRRKFWYEQHQEIKP